MCLHVEDLGSTNGTSVNGMLARTGILVLVQPATKLKIGAIELLIRHVAPRSGGTRAAALYSMTAAA